MRTRSTWPASSDDDWLMLPTLAFATPSAYREGTDGDDTLIGTRAADTLYGYAGNDLLFGNAGDDFLVGGSSYGALGSDTLYGGSGNDTLRGGTSNNLLNGNNGNDVIYGGGGNTTINGGAGDDRIEIGSGLYFANAGTGNDTIIAWTLQSGSKIYGGAGTDTLRLSATNRADDLNWTYSAQKAAIVYGTRISGFEIFDIELGSGNNTVSFATSNEAVNITGNQGSDILIGGSADDLLCADAPPGYMIYETDAKNTLRGNAGNDTLFGGYGENMLDGGDGDDLVIGYGSGTLIGGNGHDEIKIFKYGPGDTFVFGGSGNDIIRVDWNAAPGVIHINSGEGNDTIFSYQSTIAEITLDNLVGYDFIATFTSGQDKIIIDQSDIPVGNGDTVMNNPLLRTAPGGFNADNELVFFTNATSINDLMAKEAVAAVIGDSDDAYTTGQTALFVLSEGTQFAVYYFQSAQDDNHVSADELTLIANAYMSQPTLSAGDYFFIP